MNTSAKALADGLAALCIDPDPQAIARLLAYLDLLEKWNGVYNLTAIRDPAQWLTHHLLDSLSVFRHLPAGSLADIGSGAGFPGLPLALLDPDRPVTLVESNQKKTAFLTQVVGQLGLTHVRVVRTRVEELPSEPGFPIVISRAFAELADFVRLAGHLITPGGRLFAMKGLYPHDELARLPEGYACVAVEVLQVPGLDATRHLVILGRST
jgi:16S rRNA (guanine527-N7)-methyltransferase